MAGQAPAAPEILDIDTREKCQFFLAALVQQGNDIIYGVTDQGPFVIPGFLVNAGAAFGLLQYWVPGPTGAAPAPLADSPERLIDQGADLNEKDKGGRTVLMQACYFGRPEVVKFLATAKGSKLEEKDDDGHTLLTLARLGEGSAARAQAKAAAELEAVDEGKILSEACEIQPKLKAAEARMKGCQEILAYLATQGANLNEKDQHGRTPLMQACYDGQLEVVKILAAAEGSELEAKDDDGHTLLVLARSGEASAAKAQAEAAADLEAVDEANDYLKAQALQRRLKAAEARMKGCQEVLAYLATQGADLNEKDKHGRTLLMQACYNGQWEVVEILATAEGIKLHTKDDDDKMSSMLAEARLGEESAGKAEAEAEAQHGAEAKEVRKARAWKERCREFLEYFETQAQGCMHDCRERHGLVAFITPHSGFVCDNCEQSEIPKGTGMWGCRQCNYDLCQACAVSNTPGEVAEASRAVADETVAEDSQTAAAPEAASP